MEEAERRVPDSNRASGRPSERRMGSVMTRDIWSCEKYSACIRWDERAKVSGSPGAAAILDNGFMNVGLSTCLWVCRDHIGRELLDLSTGSVEQTTRPTDRRVECNQQRPSDPRSSSMSVSLSNTHARTHTPTPARRHTASPKGRPGGLEGR